MTKAMVKVLLIRDGEVVAKEEKLNVTTATGMAALANDFIGGATTSWKYIAIGSGSQAAVASVTHLVSSVVGTLAAVGRYTTTYSNDTASISAGFPFTTSATIQEAGLFSSNTGGTMFGYILVGPWSVVSGDFVSITWTEQMV